MQAWVLDDSPGSYRWGSVPCPEVGPSDIRIRVVASALNHMDLWLTRGRPRPRLPHVPGCDVAGVVDAVGLDVTSVSVGDEVVVNPAVSPVADIVALGNDAPLGPGFQIVGEHRWGGHAHHVVVPARNALPRPRGRSWEDCAAFPLAHLTAYRMLRRARVRAGETVLVVGIGSGVSSAALAIARAMGAHVVVTSRDAEKRRRALDLGAHQVLDSAAERWDVTAQVVVESVGPATWDRSIRALAPGGRLVVCGGTSGTTVTLNLPRLFFRQHEIIGSTMGSYEEFSEVADLMSQGLDVFVDQVMPLDDYPKALQRLEIGAHLGKIVLRHPD
jgi:zinc-binding alcohol dehydrogenase/oxidoreductase